VPKPASIVDIGCGTGVAGAAWALEMEPKPRVIGIDRNPWVLQECKWTYHTLGIDGTVRSQDVARVRVPPGAAVIAAFTMNELDSQARVRFHEEFLRIAAHGMPVLIVEPIARRLTAWWDDWARDWTDAGGRHDEWRFQLELPERLALMDKAAGLNHRELTARSLWIPGSSHSDASSFVK
jgi:hypothetical protein